MTERIITQTYNGKKQKFKIILDEDNVEYFDSNEWICRFKDNKLQTLSNKKTNKLLHRIIMGVENNKNFVIKVKNPLSGDFRKENLYKELIPKLKKIERMKEEERIKKEKERQLIEAEKNDVFVFVDTETTGFPWKKRNKQFYSPRYNPAYDNARLISLAYIIVDGKNNTLMEPKQLFVKPTGFIIPEDITELTGITNEYAKKNGKCLKNVVTEFENDIKKYKVKHLVSHNVNFDKYILMNSALRRNWVEDSLLFLLENEMKYKCTMRIIDEKTGNFQKLGDCVRDILKEEPSELHNALNDMLYCKRIYFELIK